MDLNKVVAALGSSGVPFKAGGLAAVGAIAWEAYQQVQQGQQALEPAASEAEFTIDAADAGDASRGLLVIRAMIAAAGADGHLDDAERQRILRRMQGLNLAAEEKAIVVEELLCPCSLEQILAAVQDQATAIEVYAASALVLAEGDRAGELYLQRLASRLALSPGLVEAIRSSGVPAREQAA